MSPTRLTIVGIGASAGGLEAFRAFFAHMPVDSGMAFVVILHLPANRTSMLPDILGRWTGMRVVEAGDGDTVAANTVYVPPPHAITTLREGRLRIRIPDPAAPREDRPIDGFFDALAADARENAVGIVLSGTGTDGSLGLKSIRVCGGFTLVQGTDGSRPQYEGMPSGAIAAGVVDIVAAVEDLPAHLVRLLNARDAGIGADAESAGDSTAARLTICTILRTHLGHDFSGYKEKTFLRRVHRRMQMVDLPTLAAYIDRLRADHDEAVLLFRDLLIRVTSFFRDAATFETLERDVIPRLFEGKYADGVVRVWVPGCATGEEAYSLAILLREYMDRLRGPPRVQVFATDIDEPAIGTARAGRYTPTLLDGISEARRQRFFIPAGATFVVAKEIREICTFSAHSLVRDPPFSRMDMVSCRNLLIYLDAAQQSGIMPAFHRSLVPRGILLLGSSENTSRHEELFAPVNKPLRIFERRDVPSPPFTIAEGAERARPGTALPRPTAINPRSSATPGGTGTGTGAVPLDTSNPSTPNEGLPRSGDAAGAGIAFRLRTGVRAALHRLYPGVAGTESLHRQLSETHDQLQSMTEEHDTTVEELRSANEELHSVNEELQSTNEELETSKEELQSVNEELQTVNAQLSEKVEELDRANSDIRNLFDSTEVATIFLDRHLIIRGYTPAVGSIYNLIPSDHGRPITDIASRLNYDGLGPDVAHVLDTLHPMERRVARKDRNVHYIMRILPYRAPDSTVDGTLVTFVDVTSIVQAEIHQRLLVDELNHRVKNMLTVVISLATQTLRRAESLDAFADAFMGRVQALTASYSLLSSANWQSIPLRDVLLEETRPFLTTDRPNIVMNGPDVRLAPQGALALGMAVHELATNAVKYGALASPEGSVHITWSVGEPHPDGLFVLQWIETGGPTVEPPAERGFGMTVIERGFAHELNGRADVEFTASGLRAVLTAPLGDALYMENATNDSDRR